MLTTTPLRLRLGTSRRKFRADPAYPAACACGNNRFAEIRPNVFSTRATRTKSLTWSKFRPGLPGQALTGLVRLNDPAHRLMRRAADLAAPR